jgi:septal ring factor EnvC (AmiA/AmiB activator)
MNWISVWRRFASRCLPATRHDVETLLKPIMATQNELAATLKEVRAQQEKTATEIQSVQAGVVELKDKITELEGVIANGEANQELTDAVAAVKAQAQVVDDLIPDVAPPTT